jgi:uncharacterized protein YidB (DUF937 family)
MGLLDEVLKTMQAGGVPNDPRARPAPVLAPTPGVPESHGMSPMAKALLALLAAYAAKNLRRAPSQAPQPTSPTGRSGGTVTADNMPSGGGLDDLLKGPLGGLLRGGQGAGTGAGGGLGDLLRGPLGGILAGAAAGTALNGGLGDLLKQLQQSGQSDAVNSWIGSGPNKSIQGRDLESALGADTLATLAGQTGMQYNDLLGGLSQVLPRFVDALTPDGRLMSDAEAEQTL